jgi:hypothetical protein
MEKYSVLLDSYTRLPARLLQDQCALILGRPIIDVRSRLQSQQGILFEGLPQSRAEQVSGYLESEGFQTMVLPTEFIPVIDFPCDCNISYITDGGILITCIEGGQQLIPRDDIKLIQAGFIDPVYVNGNGFESSGYLQPRADTSSIQVAPGFTSIQLASPHTGWQLNIFTTDPDLSWLRVQDSSFEFAYIPEFPTYYYDGFHGLTADLGSIIPVYKHDPGFRIAESENPVIPSGVLYHHEDYLNERARWLITIVDFGKAIPSSYEV